jgi:hypothetical protein
MDARDAEAQWRAFSCLELFEEGFLDASMVGL